VNPACNNASAADPEAVTDAGAIRLARLQDPEAVS
jgi:hypothetical protein